MKAGKVQESGPATFKVKAPDGSIITDNAPPGSTEEQAIEFAASTWKPKAAITKPDSLDFSLNNGKVKAVGQGIKDAAGGLTRSGMGLASNLMRPIEAMIPGGDDGSSGHKSRMARVEGRFKSQGYDPESASFQGGKLGGDIAATLPVGGALGKLAGKAGLPALQTALATGGFRTGLPAATTLAGKTGQMALRSGAGAAGALTAQTLIDGNFDNAGTAGTIGALLPPGLKALGYTGGALAKGAKALVTPSRVNTVNSILKTAGATSASAAQELRNKLMPVGPSILPESTPTVPQLLQNPGISQLQRTLKAVGDTQIAEREALQNAARLRGLDRISPVSGTVQQAAEDMGNTVERFALPANKQASEEVSKKYMGVDPARESGFMLPINKMDAARQTYLGPGTFGSGGDARQAIKAAQGIGTREVTEQVPVPLNLPPERVSTSDSLLGDIRRMGGIKLHQIQDITGEGRVGKGRSLPPNLFKNSGMGIDDLATSLRAKGYDIPDDVDGGVETLRDMVRRELDGDKVYPMQAMEDEAASRSSSLYDDTPEPQYASVKTIEPRAVPFEELQNLRSSIGEAAYAAKLSGRNKEAGALSKMKAELDAGIEKVAAGRGEAGEYFPPEMVKRWRDANSAHAARINRFETGPQAAMFRQGGDGQRSAQGAELAGKFFNSTRSQVEDAQAFKRLAGDNNHLLPRLKNYAITDAANQTNALGTLSNSKFNNWRDARSGALRETMAPEDLAMLEQIGRELKLADSAERLGMSTGSNTVQNANNALKNGLIDNPLVGFVGGKIPLANSVLSALRESAKKSKAEKLGGLLANPEEMDAAIAQYLRWKQQGLLGGDALMLGNKLAPSLYRATPLLSSDRSSR